jgi:hypothetical protein
MSCVAESATTFPRNKRPVKATTPTICYVVLD